MTISATLGNAVRIGRADDPILVRDVNGALVNPATITVTITRPDGTKTTPTAPSHYLDQSSAPIVGTFYFDYEPPFAAASAGLYEYEIRTTGPDGSMEGSFYFRPSRFV